MERFRDPPNDVLQGDLEIDVSVVGIQEPSGPHEDSRKVCPPRENGDGHVDSRGHEKCEDGQAEYDGGLLDLSSAPRVALITTVISGERSKNDSECMRRTGLAHTGTIPTGS